MFLIRDIPKYKETDKIHRKDTDCANLSKTQTHRHKVMLHSLSK